jgi:lysophospholipase L1-like esterase
MRTAALSLLAALLAVPAAAQDPRYEKEVTAFETSDRTAPPPKGQIVFVGSSTIVDWDAAKYFPDLKIINRGLWGSSLVDTVRLVDRIVLPYQPRLIVMYAGDNDIDSGQTSEEVTVQFERFVKLVHARLPQTRILFIGIKPSLQRWTTVDRGRLTNDMIRAFCSRDDRVAFLDVDGVMLGWDEKPRKELYADDGLHLSAQGYQLWTAILRPFLAGAP